MIIANIGEAPLAADIFTGICGLMFVIAGCVFFFKSEQVSCWACEAARKAGNSPSRGFPTATQVKSFGFIASALGMLLTAFAVWLLFV